MIRAIYITSIYIEKKSYSKKKHSNHAYSIKWCFRIIIFASDKCLIKSELTYFIAMTACRSLQGFRKSYWRDKKNDKTVIKIVAMSIPINIIGHGYEMTRIKIINWNISIATVNINWVEHEYNFLLCLYYSHWVLKE